MVRSFMFFTQPCKILLTTLGRPANAAFKRFPRRKDLPHFGVSLFVRRYAFYTGSCERLEFISFYSAWKLRGLFIVPDESSIDRSLFDSPRIFNENPVC